MEILMFMFLLIIGVLSLPIFFFFLWIADSSSSYSSLITIRWSIAGVIVNVFSIYFGRVIFFVLKNLNP